MYLCYVCLDYRMRYGFSNGGIRKILCRIIVKCRNSRWIYLCKLLLFQGIIWKKLRPSGSTKIMVCILLKYRRITANLSSIFINFVIADYSVAQLNVWLLCFIKNNSWFDWLIVFSDCILYINHIPWVVISYMM